MRRRLAAALLGVFVLGAAPVALAQPKKPPPEKPDPKLAEAKRIFDAGTDFYEKGDYEGAIESWQSAFDMSHKTLILESISKAYERLGDFRKAREALAKWRADAPESEQANLDERLKRLDERVKKLDEEDAARAEAEKQRQAELEAAKRKAAEGSKPPKKATSLPGLILVGAGGGAVVVGVALDLLASARRPDPADACKTVSGRSVCRSSDKGAITGSNGMALAGDVIWIVGAAAVAGGAVLILTQKTEPAPKPAVASVHASAAALPGGGYVGVGGRFW